jgi:putative aldouronate transport system permease protein
MSVAGRRSFGSRLFDAVNYAFMAVFTVATLYPFYYCIVLSLNQGKDAERGGIYFWPRAFTVANYQRVFAEPLIMIAARNSVLRTVIGTVTSVLFTAMYAYVISRPKVRLRRFYVGIGMVTMYFGGGLIPYYLLIRGLGMLNTFMVYVIPGLFTMFYAVMFMTFFRTIPASLEESAKIDGANDFTVFVRIFLPISTPVLATIALYTGVGHWNSWFDTMLFAQKDHLETLSHMLVKLINTQRYYEQLQDARSTKQLLMKTVTSNSLELATMVVTAFPIIVAYPFLQKYFVKGIMIGSIKG